MRTYTSIEQSLELSKILPIDSSDMCHIQEYHHMEYRPYFGNPFPSYGQYKVRGWSLGALMEIIVKTAGQCDIEFSSETGNLWTCRLSCEKKGIDLGVIADSQIDALFDIICLLNKTYHVKIFC